MTTHLKDAYRDEIAAMHYGEGWRSVDTMPEGEIVTVLTVRGLHRKAKAPEGTRWLRRSDGNGPRRLLVSNGNGGQWWAVAWRLDEGSA